MINPYILLCFYVKLEVNAVFQSQLTNRKLITTLIDTDFKVGSSCFYILRYCHTSYLLPIILFFTVKVIKCLIQCDLYFYISVKFCHKN